MTMKYEVIIWWSEEDRAFLAEVPELPGCMADGPSPEDALSNVKTVAELWIEAAKQHGHPIPEAKGRLKYA